MHVTRSFDSVSLRSALFLMTIIGLFVFTAENAVLFHAAQPAELLHIVGPFDLATVVRRGIWLVTFKALLFNTSSVVLCINTNTPWRTSLRYWQDDVYTGLRLNSRRSFCPHTV